MSCPCCSIRSERRSSFTVLPSGAGVRAHRTCEPGEALSGEEGGRGRDEGEGWASLSPDDGHRAATEVFTLACLEQRCTVLPQPPSRRSRDKHGSQKGLNSAPCTFAPVTSGGGSSGVLIVCFRNAIITAPHTCVVTSRRVLETPPLELPSAD